MTCQSHLLCYRYELYIGVTLMSTWLKSFPILTLTSYGNPLLRIIDSSTFKQRRLSTSSSRRLLACQRFSASLADFASVSCNCTLAISISTRKYSLCASADSLMVCSSCATSCIIVCFYIFAFLLFRPGIPKLHSALEGRLRFFRYWLSHASLVSSSTVSSHFRLSV